MRAQSSAKKASRIRFSIVFVFALRRQRSKRDPSIMYLMYTLSSMSLTAWLRTQRLRSSRTFEFMLHVPCGTTTTTTTATTTTTTTTATTTTTTTTTTAAAAAATTTTTTTAAAAAAAAAATTTTTTTT
ncbi:hypothetical protein ACOMHN_015188 [Nucella lapillus]